MKEQADRTPERVADKCLWGMPEIPLDDFRRLRMGIIAALRVERERADALAGALGDVLVSATPNPKEHPTMYAAWEAARRALAGPQGGEGER